jgi:hypothetical protein
LNWRGFPKRLDVISSCPPQDGGWRTFRQPRFVVLAAVAKVWAAAKLANGLV